MLQLAVRLGLTAVAVPVALAVTLLLYPVWSWLERTTGIEAWATAGPPVGATWQFGCRWLQPCFCLRCGGWCWHFGGS